MNFLEFNPQSPPVDSDYVGDALYGALFRQACANAFNIKVVEFNGKLISSLKKLEEDLISFGASKLIENEVFFEESDATDLYYIWPDYGYLIIGSIDNLLDVSVRFHHLIVSRPWRTHGKAKSWQFSLHFTNVKGILNKHFAEAEYINYVENKEVYMLLKQGNDFVIRSVGTGGSNLVRENYMEDVLGYYDALVNEFGKKDPFGRLAIIHGFPGCGKTHMIRGLINEIPNSKFVIVPANMIESLASPEFIPALLNFNDSDDKENIVFILEDADRCLVKRESSTSTLEALSTLLNFSDGIIGAALNIRIVATANVNKDNMDNAVIRDGRLQSQFEISKLHPDKALQVYKRLTDKDYVADDVASALVPAAALSKVYALAKKS